MLVSKILWCDDFCLVMFDGDSVKVCCLLCGVELSLLEWVKDVF